MALSALKKTVPLIVSPEWLHASLKSSSVIVYDATWNKLFPQRKHGRDEWVEKRIADALFFDIDDVCDKKTSLPHMLPTPEDFADKLSSDGVRNTDHVIVYDSHGQLSAARVFWTFKVFGHEQVSVLNGGLPAWIARNYEVHDATSPPKVRGKTPYKASFKPALVRNFEDVTAIIDKRGPYSSSQIVDARPKARFDGTAPEPRPIPSGHMPGALNVPMGQVLNAKGEFLEPSVLREVFTRANVDLTKPVVTSCGSGVTASVIYLSLLLSGVPEKNLSLYDGSWTEYAAHPDAVIDSAGSPPAAK